MFLKDRQVSSFGCFVFDFWVLRFRDLGALFSSFGCFVLRSSFSSASFSQLPACIEINLNNTNLPKRNKSAYDR